MRKDESARTESVTFNFPYEILAFNITDAARALGVGRGLIHELIKNGRLASTIVGGRRIIPRNELERLVREGGGGPMRRGRNAVEAGRASGVKRAALRAAEGGAECAEPKAAPTPRPVRFENGVAVK